MRTFYKVEIRFTEMHERRDRAVREIIEPFLPLEKNIVEDQDDSSVTLLFSSELAPTEARRRLRICIQFGEPIHYVSVIYRYENEMNCDMFVAWTDGRWQEYIGRTVWEETDN